MYQFMNQQIKHARQGTAEAISNQHTQIPSEDNSLRFFKDCLQETGFHLKLNLLKHYKEVMYLAYTCAQ